MDHGTIELENNRADLTFDGCCSKIQALCSGEALDRFLARQQTPNTMEDWARDASEHRVVPFLGTSEGFSQGVRVLIGERGVQERDHVIWELDAWLDLSDGELALVAAPQWIWGPEADPSETEIGWKRFRVPRVGTGFASRRPCSRTRGHGTWPLGLRGPSRSPATSRR